MDRSSTEGALVEAPKAPRGVGCAEGPHPGREGVGKELDPSPEFLFLFHLKVEHF